MPEVTIVYWRDIPAQVIVGSGRRAAKMPLPERFELAIDRCAMRAGARDSDAYLGECLALVFIGGLTGELDRLKVCRNPDCRWVFYDRSPGQSSVWCSMDLCGARQETRYRSRHAR